MENNIGHIIQTTNAVDLLKHFTKDYLRANKSYLVQLALDEYKKTKEFNECSEGNKGWYISCEINLLSQHIESAIKYGD